MRITIESTGTLVGLDAAPLRVWRGTTAGGVPVVALVRFVAAEDPAGAAAFEPLRAALIRSGNDFVPLRDVLGPDARRPFHC